MSEVLGTPVWPLAGDAATSLLISDLHVPADGGEALRRLRGAVAAAAAARWPLLVLGDLFDSYVCRAQVRHGVWREVAALFAQLTSAGVPVTLLHGNRDFLLGDEFAAASGARIVAGGLRGPLGGVDTLLLHGDELCQNDLPYQRAKRWLRSRPLRWLLRPLPLAVALWVAGRARRKSRRVVATGDQTRFLPTRGAVDAAFATGVQRLVFGHIHRPAHGRHGAGEYFVLPAFDATGVGLLVGAGRAEPVRFPDERGAWTPARLDAPCPFGG